MEDYKEIKVVGFDLDQTLYQKSPEIDTAIQRYIFKKIADYKKIDTNEAEILFKELYKDGRGLSGSKTLAALDIPNSREIVQEALELADLTPFLVKNQKTTDLLLKLKDKFSSLDIITGSTLEQTKKKLSTLEIPIEIFEHIITADDASKSSGEAYYLWFSHYKTLSPKEFLYVGDRERSDHEIPSSLGIKTILVNVEKINPKLDILQLKNLEDITNYI